MAEDKPRLARLTAIITQLQSKKIVTARDIAKKHKVSIRTVYRDIRTLEKSGIPIITEEGKGYSIMEGYKLPPVMFTEQEANALITAEQIIAKNKDLSLAIEYKSAIEKIKSILKYSQKDKTELLSERIQIRVNLDTEKTSNYLIQLQSAITNYQIVHLDYHSLQNKSTKRHIEPFALIHTQDNWVLIAFCRLRSNFRFFRLDCIRRMTTSRECFEPHKITLQEYFEKKRKIYEHTPDIPLTQPTSTFVLNKKIITMQKVKIEPFKVIGIAVRTTNQNGQAAQDLGQLWGKFMSEGIAEKIPNKIEQSIFSIYTNYEGDHTQPYDTILGLVFGIWSEINQQKLNRVFTADFDVYGEKAQNPTDAEVEVFVGLKNETTD